MDHKTLNCECGDMFTRKNNLQRHKKQSCNISNCKPYREKCPYRFSFESPLHSREAKKSTKIFEELRSAGDNSTSPLDFHFVGEEKPPSGKEKGDELSDGSSIENTNQ